jgi:3-phenylpropionate/cinnamic acid dioxygenase small subunit
METVRTTAEGLAERVALIEDRTAVVETISRYCRLLDTHEWDALLECFTEDLHVEHGAVFPPMDGRENFVGAARHFLPRMRGTQHYTTDHEVTVEGDEARCVNSLYAIHDVDGEEGRQIVPAGARYHARLRRTPEGWRIYELIIEETWEDARVPGLYAG